MISKRCRYKVVKSTEAPGKWRVWVLPGGGDVWGRLFQEFKTRAAAQKMGKHWCLGRHGEIW